MLLRRGVGLLGSSLRLAFGRYPGRCWFYESLRHVLWGGCRRLDRTGNGAEVAATTQVDVWTKKEVRERL